MVLTRAEYARGIGAFHKTIAVDVGPEKQRFYLHTKLLAEDSEFFKAAIKPRWDMPGREALDLSDEDPLVFVVFANWLYERGVAIDTGTLNGRDKIDHIDSTLIKAYAFAQRRLSPRFHDVVISAFARRLSMRPSEALNPANMSFLFDESSQGSFLRRLMIDYIIWQSSRCEGQHLEDCQHPEFLRELSKAQALLIRQQARSRRAVLGETDDGFQYHDPSDPTEEVCKYHQHNQGEDDRICDLYEPNFDYVDEGTRSPGCGVFIEFTAGLEAKTFHAHEMFFPSMERSDNLASKPFHPELSCAAIELLLQWTHLNWDLTDVVHTVQKYGSREKDNAVLMQLTHLHYIGVEMKNRKLFNETTDAIVEWNFICRRPPFGQCLSFAYDYAFQTKTDDESYRLLYLLVMLLAWDGTYTLCENVRVLQILAIAQSSIRDTRAHMSRRQRQMPQDFPKEDPYVCKYFHRHLDNDPVCYRGSNRSSKADEENSLHWGELLPQYVPQAAEKAIAQRASPREPIRCSR